MKKIIRRGTFETNSSSTHTLTMMMKSDYQKWLSGELYLTTGYPSWFGVTELKQLVTKEEAIELLKQYKYLPSGLDWNDEEWINDLLGEAGFRDSNDESEWLEPFYSEFTTPSGEVVVAFGEYGYDG